MSVLAIVQTICREQMSQIANKICDDYKSSVKANLKHPENSSGEAAGSISVTQTGATSYRIGASNLHLYFFEMGNGGGGIPKNPPPVRPMPMTYGSRGRARGFAMRASNYKGQEVFRQVARRWN